MTRVVKIFDTTLRDGEQSPGASMTLEEKLRIAQQLARLKVDIIEAGFPVASDGDFESVRRVAREVTGPVICGLARTHEKDIRRAAEALEPAGRRRIHTFIATSPIHMEKKLQKKPAEVLRIAVESVRLCREFTDDVEFSPEDAGRSESAFLYEIVAAALEAGATTINIPDTVGYTLPQQFGDLVAGIFANVPAMARNTLSVHCHNDLGLAVANSLAGVMSGANQVECTINGIGERAGNAALEEVVMAIRTRKDLFQCVTGIQTTELCPASRLLSTVIGFPVPPNKAIVGANAFAHESGIHQHGVIMDSRTYEIMHAQDVGLSTARLVLGKHSGRHAFRKRLEELNLHLTDEQVDKAFALFKRLADRKKEVFDEDLLALVEDEVPNAPQTYTLKYFHTVSGNVTIPTATIILEREGKPLQDAACGDGPVDAACNAIDRITGLDCEIAGYSLRAVTGGKDAVGEVVVTLRAGEQTAVGRGASTDVVEASVQAYLHAVNKLVQRRQAGAVKPPASRLDY
jgi:2-isopropylmalate synthase